MPTVEIYTTPICPYCVRAKRLLNQKGVAFVEIDLWQEPGRREEMIRRAQGRRTVPQIFINGRPMGGSDELHALDARGGLDPLLAITGEASGLAGQDRGAEWGRA
jgi:glutaredoxin 3